MICLLYTSDAADEGLGEKEEEIYQTFEDLRKHDVDIVTLGQYLRPVSYTHLTLPTKA